MFLEVSANICYHIRELKDNSPKLTILLFLALAVLLYGCGEAPVTDEIVCVTSTGEIIPGRTFRFLPSLIYYQEGDVTLRGDLYLPASGSSPPYPAVVFNHGGAWMLGSRRFFNSQYLGEHLACRGYAFFDVDYRLAPSIKFPQDIRDVKCAIRWLRGNADKYHIDRTRFISMGGSAGGHITAMIATTPNEPFFQPTCDVFPEESIEVQAAIPFYGVFNWVDFYEPYGKFLDAGKIYFGEEPPSEETLRRASPLTYVNETNAHFLIIHGTEDIGVPITQAIEFHEALINAGKDSTLVVIEGATHGFDGAIWSDFSGAAEKAIDEFLARLFGR